MGASSNISFRAMNPLVYEKQWLLFGMNALVRPGINRRSRCNAEEKPAERLVDKQQNAQHGHINGES